MLLPCPGGFFPQVLNQIVFLLLSFKNPLYILDDSPLLNVCFASIFSQSVACLLIRLTLPLQSKRFSF